MKKFLEKINEDLATHKPVVMAFGRMNPPTIGHEKLVNRVHQLAKDYNAPHHVILSHSVDAKKNPLDVAAKVKHAKRFFPGTNITASSKEKPTFLQHAQALHQAGHDHLVMVAGSDRIPEYEKKLNQYNGEGPGKLFNFKKIEVKSAGQRDPDAEGAEGMSASKMREHAQNNNFGEFKQGVPSHVPEKHARELFRDVRRGMGLNENVNRGLFKAIFVTGGPGSGKDVVIREAIAEQKAVEINSVQAYQYLMDKKQLSEKTNDLRREAIRNRSPLIINGPADDHSRMLTIKEELEELGYDTIMVFVDTTNEASKTRNEKLVKMVSESVRQEKWQLAQTSKEAYTQNFKKFINFDNSASFESIEEDITDTYERLSFFIENKVYDEVAYHWLETHGKLNTNDSIKVLYKEENHVKKDSRFIQRLREAKSAPRLSKTGARAETPSDIPADNRAGDPNADNIKWNANKKRGGYNFRTYTEENNPHIQVFPEPKERNFNKDKESKKGKGLKDSPSVSQRLRNQSGIGPEFDTRQQGTVYAMSGLGDVTYREEKNFRNFRNTLKEYNGFQNDAESGVGGVLGGSDNKEPMENPKNKLGYTYDTIKRKKNGVKK
jgi:predicted kinase